MLDTTITLVGNLVDDPDHRTTANGASMCTFRLASTPRRFDRSENRWVDGSTLFLRVSCWRQLADNVVASLGRGDRALVYGRLRQRSFETNGGERRVTYEIDADAVGTELTWHAARSDRPTRRTASTADAATSVPAGDVEQMAANDAETVAADDVERVFAVAAVGSPSGERVLGEPSMASPALAEASKADASKADASRVEAQVAGSPVGAAVSRGASAAVGAAGAERSAAVALDESPWQPFSSPSDLR